MLINYLNALVLTRNGGFNPHTESRWERLAFKNGYGASVVCGPYTYGGSAGLLEVCVLRHSENGTEPAYDTPIHGWDPLGYLTEEEVVATLDRIAAL